MAERVRVSDSQLTDRHSQTLAIEASSATSCGRGGRAFFDTMFEGRRVLYRLTLPFPKDKVASKGELRRWGTNNHRFVEATVTKVMADRMLVRDGFGGSDTGKLVSEFTVHDVFNRVTLPPL